MNYFILIALVIIIGGGLYLRFEDPRAWNEYLDNFKAPTLSSGMAPEAGTTDAADMNTPPASNPSAPAPPTHLNYPDVISPDSTNFINPNHIHPVEQPVQPSALSATSPTHAAATNSPPATPK